MTEKDYIAQLFRVRRERFGISDDIYWGWFNPDDGSVEWKTWRHADADGMGGFARAKKIHVLPPLSKSTGSKPMHIHPTVCACQKLLFLHGKKQ